VVTGSDNLIRTQGDFHYITTSTEDPLLGPLLDNGGPTLTHALGEGSPATDAGNNSQGLDADQRGAGFSRVVGLAADMGAYEVQTAVAPEVPGDYNRDDVVDAADFTLWRKTLGTFVPKYSGADGNGNGEVEIGDYAVWREHFGETPPSGAAGQSSPDAGTGAEGVGLSAAVEASDTEEQRGPAVPLAAASMRSLEARRVSARKRDVGISSDETAPNLLLLSLDGQRQFWNVGTSEGDPAVASAATGGETAGGATMEDAIFGEWPKCFRPVL
jgi:hypothetical protein